MKYETQWIFAAGMRRAGSTLQYHLGRELVEHVGGIAAGWVTWQQYEETYKKYNGKYPYVILKCHSYMLEDVPLVKMLFENRKGIAKVLYVYRDLRDVAASLKQYQYSNWDYIVSNEIPAILREYKNWMSLKTRVFVTRYEDLTPQANYFAMARFLKIDIHSPKVFEEMYNRHTLEAHQKVIATQKYTDKGYNKTSLLWKNHIKDGKIGKYKTVLTPEQITQIETITMPWLRERGYIRNGNTNITSP